jgi:hypothetical protein
LSCFRLSFLNSVSIVCVVCVWCVCGVCVVCAGGSAPPSPECPAQHTTRRPTTRNSTTSLSSRVHAQSECCPRSCQYVVHMGAECRLQCYGHGEGSRSAASSSGELLSYRCASTLGHGASKSDSLRPRQASRSATRWCACPRATRTSKAKSTIHSVTHASQCLVLAPLISPCHSRWVFPYRLN